MTPKELFASKAKHAEEEAERVRKMTPDEKAASKAKRIEQEAERVREMTPEEKAASTAKHAEQEADRVLKMTPDDKAASWAKHAEQEAERLRKMTPEEKGATDIQRARFGRQVPRRYVILNNEDKRSTGTFNEIHGGSFAMQAFAGVRAAMVASTLLQHTALRGIIESERLDFWIYA